MGLAISNDDDKLRMGMLPAGIWTISNNTVIRWWRLDGSKDCKPLLLLFILSGTSPEKQSAVIVTCVGAFTVTNFMICQFITKLKVKYAIREIESGGPQKEKVNAPEETTKKSAENREELGHHVVDIEGQVLH
jgi:hypothetical protein